MMHNGLVGVFILSDDVFAHFLPVRWNCSGHFLKIYMAFNSACRVPTGATSWWRHVIHFVHISGLIIILFANMIQVVKLHWLIC